MTTSVLKIESLDRIPGYAAGFDLACRFYNYGKENTASLPLLPGLIEKAENRALGFASPLLEAHRESIQSIDKFALSKINVVEDIVVKTKASVESKALPIVKSGLSLAVAAEKSIASPLRSGLKIVDEVVDIVLEADVDSEKRTPNDNQDNAQATDKKSKSPEDLGKEIAATIDQCHALASKAKRRTYKIAMSKVSDAKLRTTESVAALKQNSVDLIQYAMNINADSIAKDAKYLKECADAKIESAKRTALTTIKKSGTAAQATAEFINQYKELVRSTVIQKSQKAFAFVEGRAVDIQQYVMEQAKESETWEQFVAKLKSLNEKATSVKSEVAVKARESGKKFFQLLFQSAYASSMYENFEEFADPFLFDAFKNARTYFTEPKDVTKDEEDATSNEGGNAQGDDDVKASVESVDTEFDEKRNMHEEDATSNEGSVGQGDNNVKASVESVDTESDEKRNIERDHSVDKVEDDVGLVLKLKESCPTDIDDETVLHD